MNNFFADVPDRDDWLPNSASSISGRALLLDTSTSLLTVPLGIGFAGMLFRCPSEKGLLLLLLEGAPPLVVLPVDNAVPRPAACSVWNAMTCSRRSSSLALAAFSSFSSLDILSSCAAPRSASRAFCAQSCFCMSPTQARRCSSCVL